MASEAEIRDVVMDVLTDLTGSDEVKENPDIQLFDTGLLDSMGTVQLLLELQNRLGIDAPVSEFDRQEWATPNKIIAKVASLQ